MTTKYILQRFHRLMANAGSDIVWRSNTIDARQFLSTFLFLNFPLDVLGCISSQEVIDVRASTECIVSCFYGIVDQLRLGARMLDVDQHLKGDFLKLLFDFLDKFGAWKTSDGRRLGEKVMVSLEKLHEVRLAGGLNEDQTRELAANIESLSAYYLRTKGPRALDDLNAKLQQVALKTKAASTISRYWRFRFKTTRALAQDMVKHKITVDDMANLWCVHIHPLFLPKLTSLCSACKLREFIHQPITLRTFTRMFRRLNRQLKNIPRSAIYMKGNAWIFLYSFVFHFRDLHSPACQEQMPAQETGIEETSRLFIELFFNMVEMLAEGVPMRELNPWIKEHYRSIQVVYINQFYSWNKAMLKTHYTTEAAFLKRKSISEKTAVTFRVGFEMCRSTFSALNGPQALIDLEKIHVREHPQKECIRQLLLAHTHNGDIDVEKLKESFQRSINTASAVISKLRHRVMFDTSLPEDANPRPANCVWLSSMVRPTGDDPSFKEGFIAKAILQQKAFNYKAEEYILNIKQTLNIFDLADGFPQFRKSKIIYRFFMASHSVAVVHTKFAPYIIFTQGTPTCSMVISAVNNSVRITANGDKGCSVSVAIVEIKTCALCGKHATNKCSTCWRKFHISVRYCSKDCQTKDHKNHHLVCGRDLSDEWSRVSR
jgi:hypothetical protein